MKLLSVCLALCCFFLIPDLKAQQIISVQGTVLDSASNIKLSNTSVTVLHAKDSTLVNFTRAASNGSFAIPSLPRGRFILLLSYPGYADYIEHFQLDSLQAEKDFRQVNMTLKATLLANVIIRGKATAIKIKGDTTEFNAGSYNIEPNSRVEDLLKQLPGIQVDKDGKITAHGQTVNKVLVDGEEFFGDDPTLVTKNIRADMVDKVQLYDKKSDQATFTGIDDGETTKTINIKLKEDKKSGHFGKVDAGVGTDKFYQGQGMFNAFKSKQKFSAYGTASNTGKTGLGWEDSEKYGSSSMSVEFSEDGGMTYYSSGGDEFESGDGRYDGQGIPLARTGGLHYDTKFDGDKQTLNTNYKIGSLDINGISDVITQSNLPTGIINTTSRQSFNNNNFRQKLDAAHFAKLDTTSTLKISVDGLLKKTSSDDDYQTSSKREDNGLLNMSERKLTNEGDEQRFNANVLYTKRLKKKGRTYTINASQKLNRQFSEGYLNSKNIFYDKQGEIDSTQKIDQYKTNRTSASILNSNITYTEPLLNRLSLTVNYGVGINNTSSDRLSFNQSGSGMYELLDTTFSNDFELDQLTNQVGATFLYKNDKTTINLGSKATNVRFNQHDVFRNTDFTRNFTNWNPQFSYQHKFSQQKSLRFNYYGNNNQPRIDQVQPLRVNTDPLNIFIGNADLDPSFTSRFNVSYNSYKVLTERNLYFGGSYSFTSNDIVSNTITDEAGKSTFQSVNLSGKRPSNFYSYFSFGKKIKKIDSYLNFSLNANGNTSYTYINQVINATKSYNFSGKTYIYTYKPKKYNIELGGGPTYAVGESSLQQVNNNGWGFNGNASFTLFLPGKVELKSDVNHQFTAATASFDQDFERTIWNASIIKKFFKQDELSLSLSGNDLLNQNVGFTRNAWGNQIRQSSYTTIQRYFLFSLIWDFNKMGGKPSKN